ncbi:hypothetical protein NSZ01_31780 [Nocardioides szechwanensis]|uniref:Uncharacterized protein n=1 Tax=Nocardioides szechwanensis TaxID=1005944 RepID=A0A1H0K4V7_9ACTN|nr:hypothetical protein NSZ01_31780 [Nocardioides szechwanensis]SDO50924.1 hypothetical protein SAMN05192576_4155 [Nocardioides szechwanensis]
MPPTNDTGTQTRTDPEDVNEMAASIFIEQESGNHTRRRHPHNGYYAGDFSAPRTARRTAAADSLSVPLALLHPGPVSGWHD